MTRGGKPATEYLWMNYPEPVRLHDYRYLGRNFRERQDFKRLRERWLRRLENMPTLKRQALLSAIDETEKGQESVLSSGPF
jgi:DNA adenine methylase